VASLVGRKGFPIPYTAYVNLFGRIGSLQRFIPNSEVGMPATKSTRELKPLDVQRMFIFDLLFQNSHRHRGNFLTSEKSIYGIDHEGCMHGTEEPLRMEYMDHPVLQNSLSKKMLELVSEEAILNYTAIMTQHNMPAPAIKWMRDTAGWLEEQISLEKTAREIFDELTAE
jgi:hypothetical protein